MTPNPDRNTEQNPSRPGASRDRNESRPGRSTVQNAQLALLLEVSSTPKPGNVDRQREYPDLRFEHFVAGAIGTRPGFEIAADGGPVGRAFETAVYGMSQQTGGNTQFGAILLLTPLVAAAGRHDLTRKGTTAVVGETTVDDTVGFFAAFDHVDVAVDDPPEGMDDLDIRRGSAAEAAIREREMRLETLMAESSDVDGIAGEWTEGFPRTFEAATAIRSRDGPVTDSAAAFFLELLADRPDSFIRTQHGEETAREVSDRARAVLDGEETARTLAQDLVHRGINPGTTADIVAGGLFVALERGLEV